MSLSLILYLSGVATSFQLFLGLLAVGFVGIFIVACIVMGINSDYHKPIEAPKKIAKKAFALAILFGALACIIPPPTILYSIAAVQIGEQVLATEDGKQISSDAKDIVIDSLALIKKKLAESINDATK